MSTPTDLEQAVNTAIESRKEVEGKLQFADDIDPTIKFAATAELRRRDTQASFTKTQQELNAIRKENERLAATWANDVASKLTTEQQNELEELKHTDPEEWRQKVNQYEQQNKEAFSERRNKITQEVQQETELERRTRLLEEHNEANPKFQLTDDIIENDIPPRFTKQLETGELTFEQYLAKATEFLGKGKVVDKGEQAPGDVALDKLGGGATPQASAVDAAAKESYADELY